jgi:hypothetical protein
VRDTDFLRRPTDVALVAGAAETIAAFNRASIPVIVVTDQSGVARGYFSWRQFESIEAAVRLQLAQAAEAHLDAMLACGITRRALARYAFASTLGVSRIRACSSRRLSDWECASTSPGSSVTERVIWRLGELRDLPAASTC